MNRKKTEPTKKSTNKTDTSNKTKASNKTKELRHVSPTVLSLLPCLFFILFAAVAFYLMAVKNDVYLYAVQEHSLFVNDTSFFDNKMKTIAGLTQWLGCYFTQYFYYPWLGTLLLLALWALLFFVILRAFKIGPRWSLIALIPLFALLASEVDLGYWLYYLKMPGYWFGLTISVLLMMLILWIGNRIQGKWLMAWIPVSALLFYPIIGAWALVAVLWLGVGTWLKVPRRSSLLASAITIATIIAIPIIFYQFYCRTRIEDGWWLNIPIFQNDKETGTMLSLPFIIVALSPALFVIPFFHQKEEETKVFTQKQMYGWCAIQVILFILLSYVTIHIAAYDNYNYNAELRMYRAIDESRFDDVLAEASKAPGPMTRQMVLAKNIALMNKGECGDKMFRYDNSGEPPYVRDSLRVHLVQTCGPQLYYNYGKANFACRWSIENGVEFGFNIDMLKTLVRCAMISGENKMARRYIDILLNTTFYKSWAEEWLKMLYDKRLYHQHPEYVNISPLRGFDNTIDGDEGLCEMYIINYFSHVHKRNPKFQEQTLVYALIQKDIELFWPRFFNYATLHEQEAMPIHYQEAAYLYGNLENQVDISHMPFNQDKIVKRYAAFQQLSQSLLKSGITAEQVGEAMKSSYGDTFWWFYFFCRNIHSY